MIKPDCDANIFFKSHKTKNHEVERKPMTVCIAAICKAYPTPETENQNMHVIIGATDRMLTVGDMVEFEPKIANKIVHFSASISGMFAGDFGLQNEILLDVVPVVRGRIKAEPQNWWTVKQVAELYAKSFKQAHLKRAENAVLAPLGLDLPTFFDNQKDMDLLCRNHLICGASVVGCKRKAKVRRRWNGWPNWR